MQLSSVGAQRLSLPRLQQWEALGYGMFIHFGMTTFSGEEASTQHQPATLYAPDNLDVRQWVRLARDAGMKYAVLTAKHNSGFCLWPSQHTDYHVGNSGNQTDVVQEFVAACAEYRVVPGLYYCSWDEHHRFGSQTPSLGGWGNAYTTHEYREFQMKQVEELLTQYGKIGEFWIDIPGFLGPDGREAQYAQISRLQPDCVIHFNQGFTTGDKIELKSAWPTDLCAMERQLPSRPLEKKGYDPVFQLDVPGKGAGEYYIPGEVCDTIGWEWFYTDADQPRSDAELLAMRLICRERRVNFLLNVPPDRTGQIPARFAESLMRLRENFQICSQSLSQRRSFQPATSPER